jgi:hypothetical protein
MSTATNDNVVSDKVLERTDHVNVLEHKNFLAKAKETIAAPGTKRFRKMSISRIQSTPQSSLPFGDEAKPGFRTKTAATRLTPEELGEIEAAAESSGQGLSQWLRGTALCAARQRPADPSELVLAELWAVRYTLLNLFHAASQAAAEGRQLSPDSVLTIRDQADARKLHQARRLLEEFRVREGKERARTP